MTTPYRNDGHALRERKETLEAEIDALREQAKALASIEEREQALAKELAEIDAKIGGDKRALPLLDEVRVASPCSASWGDMVGDERVRFCGKCEKNVFNLSSMSREGAEALLRERSASRERLCVRYYQRADGTILTADCPVGVSKKRRRKLAIAAVGAGAMAIAAATGASRARCHTSVTLGGFQQQPTEVRMGDWGPGPDTQAVTAPTPEVTEVAGGLHLPPIDPTAQAKPMKRPKPAK